MNRIVALVFASAYFFVSCVSDRSPDLDAFTQNVYSPEYAGGFRILSIPGAESTLLEVTNPWQGADSVKRYLFICRGDEPAPSGLISVNGDKVSRIVCMSTSQIGLLSAFGADSLVVGVSGMDYVTNDLVKSHRNVIADVGFEGAVDYEKLLSVTPDLVLLYGVGEPSGMEEKLSELGIPFVYIGDYLEQSPLGRAEWMVALGEIVGKRDESVSVFAAIPAEYERIKAEGMSARQPKVMLNAPYSDVWFMPPVTSYMVRLISDAGGDYAYPENKSDASLPIDMEQAITLLGQSDLWLQPGQARSLTQLRDMVPKAEFSGQVYNSSADFWESGVARPDLVLSDLVTIINGAADSSLIYFEKLE